MFFTTASLTPQSTVAADNKTLKSPFHNLLSTVATLAPRGTEAQVAGTFPSEERTSFLQTQPLPLTPKEVGQCTGLSTLAPVPESWTDPSEDPASPCEGKTRHPGGLKAATVQMRPEEFGPLTPTRSSGNPGWAEWGWGGQVASRDTEELWVLEGASTWNQEPKVQILDLLRLGAQLPVPHNSGLPPSAG